MEKLVKCSFIHCEIVTNQPRCYYTVCLKISAEVGICNKYALQYYGLKGCLLCFKT